MKYLFLLAAGSCLLVALACSSAKAQVSAAQHAQKAQEYLRAHEPELARKEFAAVVAVEPQNLNAQANLGVLLYFANSYKDAEPHLKAALALDPSQSKVRALLGFCERRNGQVAQAAEDLKLALPQLSDAKIQKQAGLELVELQSASGDPSAAAATITQLRAALPTDPEVLYAAYSLYTDAAGEAMLDLSLAAPDSPQMHQAIARELVRARDNSAAISNLRTALSADPHVPGARYQLAQLLAASPSPEAKAEAKKQFEMALRDNPNDSKSIVQLGDLAAASNDHATAIADYRKALTIQPDNADASIGLAHELVETNELQAALPLLLGVVKADPSNLLAHYRLGVLYRRLHQPDDAKREVKEYERLKATRERLRGVYQDLRSGSAMGDDEKK